MIEEVVIVVIEEEEGEEAETEEEERSERPVAVEVALERRRRGVTAVKAPRSEVVSVLVQRSAAAANTEAVVEVVVVGIESEVGEEEVRGTDVLG